MIVHKGNCRPRRPAVTVSQRSCCFDLGERGRGGKREGHTSVVVSDHNGEKRRGEGPPKLSTRWERKGRAVPFLPKGGKVAVWHRMRLIFARKKKGGGGIARTVGREKVGGVTLYHRCSELCVSTPGGKEGCFRFSRKGGKRGSGSTSSQEEIFP